MANHFRIEKDQGGEFRITQPLQKLIVVPPYDGSDVADLLLRRRSFGSLILSKRSGPRLEEMFLSNSILRRFDVAVVNLDLQSPAHAAAGPESFTEIAGAISDNVLGNVPTVGIANSKLFPDQKELLHQVDRVLDSALLFEGEALIDAVVDVLERPIVLVAVNSVSVQKPLLQVLRSGGWAVRTARDSFEIARITNSVSTSFAIVENDFNDPTGEQATFDQMVEAKFKNKVPTVRLTDRPDVEFVRTEAHVHRRTFRWPNQVLDRLDELRARAGK